MTTTPADDQLATEVEFAARSMSMSIKYNTEALKSDVQHLERLIANLKHQIEEGRIWEELNVTTAAATIARRTATIASETNSLSMLTAVINHSKEA